jgi:transcriptional regulator with GAF, ATPase, and Fis domain
MDQRRLERLLTSLQHAQSASVMSRICLVGRDSTSVAGAGLSRVVDGRHQMVVASDDRAVQVEMAQVNFAEGPCVEVIASLQPFYEPDLASSQARERWPSFGASALDNGVQAVFAFPLFAGGIAVGALDLYASSPGSLGREEVENALVLAALAAIAVDQHTGATEIADVEIGVEPAQPWAHSAAVHNATGMVSQQLGIEVDEAFLRLRAVAFATDRPLADVARAVIGRQVRVESWAQHE